MAMRHDIHRARPHTLAHIAVVLKRRSEFVENAKDRLVKTDIDELSLIGFLPRLQSEQGPKRTIKSCHVVRDGGGSGRDGRAIRIAREKRQTAERVADTAE